MRYRASRGSDDTSGNPSTNATETSRRATIEHRFGAWPLAVPRAKDERVALGKRPEPGLRLAISRDDDLLSARGSLDELRQPNFGRGNVDCFPPPGHMIRL